MEDEHVRTLLEVIMTRRSIRDFKEGNVPPEDVERILRAGIMAPSPGNSQPWRFHVIRGKTKGRFVEILKNAKIIPPSEVAKGAKTIPPSWRHLLVKGMETVPVVVAVENAVSIDRDNITSLGSLLGTAASTENVLLAAHSLGYGSVKNILIAHVSLCRRLQDFMTEKGDVTMEVLEAIQKRRTVRIPFDERKVSKKDADTLLEISRLSPSGDPVSWRLVIVEDDTTKSRLAEIVKEDFGDSFQKDSQKFRRVFSKYPRWLHFSEAEAKDGAILDKPKFAKYFYDFALGKTFGPLFGKLGIMNSEFEAYCKNIISNPLLFGVFLNRHAKAGSTGIKPIVNTGSMLQNLRLTATSLGLCYQDLGWITATKESSEKARQLLKMPEDYVAINFFRIGYADGLDRRSQKPKFKTDFRRDLKDIVHLGRCGSKDFEVARMRRTDIEVLDAIKGKKAERAFKPISKDELGYVLEAARWAPTGFNVQPFEFVITEQEKGATIVVLEDRQRKDPDPGPCEVLARGGVLQNVRLAARALGLDSEVKKLAATEEENMRRTLSIPQNYSVMGLVELT